MTLDVISAARRRTRRLMVLVLVATGIVAGLVGLVFSAAAPTSLPNEHPTGAGSTTSTGDATAGPELAPGELVPADASWVQLAGVPLPVSAATGPTETLGSLARGFAPTPAGAVVAALHLLVRTSAQVGPAVFEPTIDEQVVGEHATAMRHVVGDLYRRGAAQAGAAYGHPLGDLPARLVGVRIDSFSDVRAEVSVLTAAVDATGVTRYAATTVTVIWSDGDWRLLAPSRGSWDDLVHIVDAAQAAGYTSVSGR